MCALVLLDAAKRTDLEFGAPYQSSHHTTKSADDDINKMVTYLIEKRVTQQSEDGAKIPFKDPLVTGMQKLVDGWLKKFLVSSEELDTNTEDDPSNEVELNYELHNQIL